MVLISGSKMVLGYFIFLNEPLDARVAMASISNIFRQKETFLCFPKFLIKCFHLLQFCLYKIFMINDKIFRKTKQ